MRKKSTPPLIKHANHQVKIILEQDSKHAARYHCVTCNKFVAWVGKQELIQAQELGMIN